MRFPTMWYVQPAKAQTSLHIRAVWSEIVSEYDQEIPQPHWHREDELLNHHETPGRQIKQSNQLSLPHQDDCNTRMDIK